MPLVKTSKIAASAPKPAAVPTAPRPKPAARASGAGPERVAERIAAATEELASGLAEASAAAEQLRRAMEQIAAGGEEAAGASQEQLAAIKNVVANLTTARVQGDASRRRTEVLQAVLAESSGQITASVRAIERNAQRQQASLAIIAELERRARDIGEITGTVSRISDQTNLLGAERGHRGGARRRPRPRFRGCGRRGAGAGGDVGEERAGSAGPGRHDPARRRRGGGPGEVRGRDGGDRGKVRRARWSRRWRPCATTWRGWRKAPRAR